MKPAVYRFSVRDKREDNHQGVLKSYTRSPIGFAVEVTAVSELEALRILRDSLPEYEEVDAMDDTDSVSPIRVYFYPETLTVEDIEEVEDID